MQKNATARKARAPRTAPAPKTQLKAERIQGSAPHLEPLKAERIQLFVLQFPGWRVRGNNRTLAREFALPGRDSALAFLGWIAALTADLGRAARVEWSGGDVVTVLLPQRPGGGLTEADLELARQLEGAR